VPGREGPGPGQGGPLAVLAAMSTELRPLLRALRLRPGVAGGVPVWTGRAGTTQVLAATLGVGPDAARRSSERVLDAAPIARVLVIGVAGGVDPGLALADVLAPRLVVDQVTGDEFRPSHPPGVDPDGTLLSCATVMAGDDTLTTLRAQGISAVDMETAAVAAVCEQRGCAWSVYRAISDRLADGLLDDRVLTLIRPDGRLDPGAVTRFVVRRPGEVRRLARLGRDTRNAVAAVTRRALGDVGPPAAG